MGKAIYQLNGGKLKIQVIALETWNVIGIRSDNGKVDTFPVEYFKKFFREIESN